MRSLPSIRPSVTKALAMVTDIAILGKNMSVPLVRKYIKFERSFLQGKENIMKIASWRGRIGYCMLVNYGLSDILFTKILIFVLRVS